MSLTLARRFASKIGTFSIAVIAALSLSSCAQRQLATQAQPRSIASIEQERARAAKFDAQILAEAKLNKDGTLNRYMRDIAAKLKGARPAGAPPITLRVLDDETPNAFTTGGGYIYIYTGLIKIMQNEAQLAMVIGHEMAHGDLDHINKNQKTGAIANTLGKLAQIAIDQSLGSGAGGQFATVGAGLALKAGYTSFSRDHEREADLVGFRYLAAAGYNTHEGARSFAQLQKASGGGSGVPWLSSHPLSSERLKTLSILAKENPGGRYIGAKTYRRRALSRLR
jgi:predicted Zn-dependent protease